MESEIKFRIIPSEVNINDLYDYITSNLSFDKVVKLYKLLKFKIDTLEDMPRTEMSVYRGEVEE